MMLALLIAIQASAACPVHETDWLAGRWLAERPQGGWTEESWTQTRGGVMLGTNLSGRGDRATAFEFMRIARDENDLVFYGSPAGAAPVAFRGTSVGGAPNLCRYEIVFENPEHDFPKIIRYERRGDQLTASVAADESGTDRMTWEFRRVGD